MVGRSASDLHLTVGSQPAIRVNGHLHRLENFPALTAEDSRQLLYRILNTEQQKRLEIDRQIDLSYSIPGVARFRVNIYSQRESLAGRVPHDPGLAQDARGARPADVALRASRTSRAASSSSPARPAPVSRRRSRP